MRATGSSGGGREGFVAPDLQRPSADGVRAHLAAAFRKLIERTSPATYAIAMIALLAAALFTLHDLFTAHMAAEANAALLARLSALGASDGMLAATRADAPFDGVGLRALCAFAIALAVIALAYRRKLIAGAAMPADLHHYQDFVATIPFGVACWTADGILVVCNDHFREQLRFHGPEARSGASYHASIKRLALGGYMQLLQEDDRHRMLELHREDGSCLLIDERPLASGGFITL